MAKEFEYHINCVECHDVNALHDMIDRAREIKFETFAKKCLYYKLEKEISSGVRFEDDWYVGFYKSKFKGRDCYYVRHSAIEYIFLKAKAA